MLPFLEELRYITRRNYRDNSNVGWVGFSWFGEPVYVVDENNEPVFMPDSDEDEEEYAMYPDDSCDCITINMLADPPAFTRLQHKSQQTLIKLAEEHKLKLMELVNVLSQYMETQKTLTEDDFIAAWTKLTEQKYIDDCNSLMEHFKLENDCIEDYKVDVYIQTIRSKYVYEEMLQDCYDNLDTTNKSIIHYKYQIERMVDYLR